MNDYQVIVESDIQTFIDNYDTRPVDLNTKSYKRNIVFFDIGSPPHKKFSRAYQSGPLSFEYYVDGNKIITNCGFGYNISKKAMLLSRLTSSQTALT